MNAKALLYVMNGTVMNGMLIGFVAGALLLAVMIVSPASAHPPRDSHDPERMISVLKERLGLTEEQAEKIRAIFEEKDQKMRAIFEKYHEQRRSEESAMRKEMDTMQKGEETRIQSVLTEKQMEAYRNLRDEQHRRIQNDHPCAGVGGPGNPPVNR